MTVKHTSGPWVADNNEGFSPWTIWSRMTPTGHGTPGPQVAQLAGDSAETDADAHLIAAAPELLEAAQAAWNCIGELPPTQARVEVAQLLQAAIEKAIGEQP